MPDGGWVTSGICYFKAAESRDPTRGANGGNLRGGISLLETYLADNSWDIVAHRLAQFKPSWSGEIVVRYAHRSPGARRVARCALWH